TNIAFNATLTWANPLLRTIEQQILGPLFGEDPLEQGINETNQDEVLQRIIDEPRYASLFDAAFPDEGSPVTFPNIIKALASFTRGLTSFDTPFDRFESGDNSALSASA
ncbi:cytochrome-c peroxidase, partial [Arthrospira platensis SPKY1]|nr:cytochrome-c peroxidase [Arthrospira platensis SPKY1]